MYKLECREVGFDCSHTMTGNTEEEVLQRAREHGTKVHNLTESEIQSTNAKQTTFSHSQNILEFRQQHQDPF
jgi:predicted small metal-binding protein